MKIKELFNPSSVIERKVAEAAERLERLEIEMAAINEELDPLLARKDEIQKGIDSMKTRLSMLEKKR